MMSKKFIIGLLLPLLFFLAPIPLPLTTYLGLIVSPAFIIQILPKINLLMVERALFNISGLYLLFWVLSPILLNAKNAPIFIHFDYLYLPIFAWLPLLQPLHFYPYSLFPSDFELKWGAFIAWIIIWVYRIIF